MDMNVGINSTIPQDSLVYVKIDSYNPAKGSMWITLPLHKNVKDAPAKFSLRRVKKEKATYELIPEQGLASCLSGIEFCHLCKEIFDLLPEANTIRYFLSYSPSYLYWYNLDRITPNNPNNYSIQLLNAITVDLGNPDISTVHKG